MTEIALGKSSNIAAGNSPGRLLTAPEFQRLTTAPPEAQWFANLDSTQTRRAYENDIRGFMKFAGIVQPEEFRTVARGHVLAWRRRLDLDPGADAGLTHHHGLPSHFLQPNPRASLKVA